MLLERIYCKYHNRQKVKDAIDDNLPVIVTNWCLIHTGKQLSAPREKLESLADELLDALVPGIFRLYANYIPKGSRFSVIDEVMSKDARVNCAWTVNKMVLRRFLKVGKELQQSAVDDWVLNGYHLVRAVYRMELELEELRNRLLGDTK